MSEHDDKRSQQERSPRAKERANDTFEADEPKGDALQGEGDYRASRRYREQVADFIASADVDALAHQAAPGGAHEARDLALAEASGRDRSKGDDAADPGLMYPNRKTPRDQGG